MRTLLLALGLLAAPPAGAAVETSTGTVKAAGPMTPADRTTVELVEYFLKAPTDKANPRLVSPFLDVDPRTLPKGLRDKARAKQLQIRALLKLHDTRKKGLTGLRPVESCKESDYTYPLGEYAMHTIFPVEKITEDELEYLVGRTKCDEHQLGCQFSLRIFVDPLKKKPRKLILQPSDPLAALLASYRGRGSAGTNFFGASGPSCRR